MYVVQTDAPCSRCKRAHGYITKMCLPLVFESSLDASWAAHHLEGSVVRDIGDDVPQNMALYRDRRVGNLDFDGVR